MMRMNAIDQLDDKQLQSLKQSILDTSKQKKPLYNENVFSFRKLQQHKNHKSKHPQPINQMDILQGSQVQYPYHHRYIVIQSNIQYLKLLCHQKKSLSIKRADKVNQLNQSLKLQQQDYKYLFTLVTQAHYFILQHPMYYNMLLQQACKYPKSMFSSIEKDIHRTFFNNHPFQSCLRNVLTAFAIRNPNLLYCQGMNYLVAYFLINSVSEQQAFWVVVCLVENVLPDDYFKDLGTISIATQIFADVIPYIFPQMAKEMMEIGMDTSLFIVSWYVCLFTKGFINSVSAYLLTRLILERRNHSMGFILLKFSLGIIAVILGRDQPFSYRPQFTAFRDKFETSVFETTLQEIKLGIEYVELNEQNYLKLQKYYRNKKEQRHMETLQSNLKLKRFLLPVCNLDFPICLHRMEIQRKIGNVEEAIINTTAKSIQSQYIEDYFDHQPKKESSCEDYKSINQCLLYRHNHVCQLYLLNQTSINLQNFLTNRKPLRHDQSFEMQMMAENSLLQQEQGQNSIQIARYFSNTDQKFRELSGGFFVVDEDFNFYSDDDVEEIPFEEQQQAAQRMSNLGSGSNTNIDESLSLNNQKDWIKSQHTVGIEEHTQQKDQTQSDVQIQRQQKNLQQGQQYSIQASQDLKKATKSNKSIGISQSQRNFFRRFQIWNFLGKTWRRVAKIKDQQLKN